MDISHGNEDYYTVALYAASLDGSVSTLDTLMQRDRLILHKISLTSFNEPPLHITALLSDHGHDGGTHLSFVFVFSTLLGHLQFTNALLRRKPQLVEKVDSSGRTALHLAYAEGHTQVVKALLQANMDMCLVSDQEEKIPLHLAAMRGHVEVIKELLIAHPRSISRVNMYGDNVLHLCVRHNCLDALKLLVAESINNEDFVNSKDNDGNSILHLAVMLGQMKPAGVRRSNDLSSPLLPASHDEEAQSAQPIIEEQPALSRFRKWWRYFYLCRWVKHLRRHGNWIDETRGTLMLVATVIATVTFQAGINPPGGVWQQDSKNGTVTAGTSIFQSPDSDKLQYQYFLYSNTISFVAVISVLLVVISGFPLRNKFSIWLLTLTMFIAISAMTLTYFYAPFLLNPTAYFGEDYFQYIVIVVLVAAGAVHIIRLLFWIGKLLLKFIRWLITKCPAKDAINV
ncbi:hypothetical protein I3842_03G107800 [Carya illinoinensis]|uniref:PGG domain-containing protein n=1 Tax=Carya illinoinensis TaxID=32201 RepID=A0A922JUV7_CARIL|nr:hypothetical protein I3842_03G107800 [Carya illinoinensis]